MNTPDKFEVINDEPQEGNKQEKAESRKNKTCAKLKACKKCKTCKVGSKQIEENVFTGGVIHY